jgi:hypothetical protein
MVSGFAVQTWIRVAWGTVAGAALLYLAVALTPIGSVTVLLGVAAVGILIFAWIRAFDPTRVVGPTTSDGLTAVQSRLLVRLSAINVGFGLAAVVSLLAFGVGEVTVFLVLTIGLALWLSSSLTLWRCRSESPGGGRGGATSSHP